MKGFLKNNGLSLVFFFLFLVAIVGQAVTGMKQHNEELKEEGAEEIGMAQYLRSGHFLQATFENWESEFLQMALYVVLTMFLYQRGSAESKDPDKKEEVDREPDPKKKDAPWPVRKGGVALAIYRYSLGYVLTLIFVLSFLLHWYGSLKDFNEEQYLKGKSPDTAIEYLGNSRLWFESFQNWESEFVSILAMVMFSIYLRQQRSSQSKPVDAAHSETGD